MLPPPNWAEKYPDGYTDATGFPNLADDEHFQVWMRVAALPTFRKLWGRNDNDVMAAGTYRILINMSGYPRLIDTKPADFVRLPCQVIRWHEVGRYLYRVMDWRQAAILRMGLYRCRHPMCHIGPSWSDPTSRPAT